jgi:hypothetical protein
MTSNSNPLPLNPSFGTPTLVGSGAGRHSCCRLKPAFRFGGAKRESGFGEFSPQPSLRLGGERELEGCIKMPPARKRIDEFWGRERSSAPCTAAAIQLAPTNGGYDSSQDAPAREARQEAGH